METHGSAALPARERIDDHGRQRRQQCRSLSGLEDGLQKLADEIGLRITVSHFPPGTSKWNKIEHRMFCHISKNWRGRPLLTHDVVVNLIASTTTHTGLTIKAKLDKRSYPTGNVVTDADFDALNIKLAEFHGDWNYVLAPSVST